MEKITRVEGHDVIKSKQGSINKGSYTSNSYIYYGGFLVFVKLCEDLNALCAKFWWGQVGNERKIHWKNWGSLTQPKADGGMRFRDFEIV